MNWKEVRKSNEQFLSEIYERAKKESKTDKEDVEEKQTFSKPRFITRIGFQITTVAAALCAIVLIGQDRTKENQEIELRNASDLSMYRAAQESDTTPDRFVHVVGKVNAYSTHEDMVVLTVQKIDEKDHPTDVVEIAMKQSVCDKILENEKSQDLDGFIGQMIIANVNEVDSTGRYELMNEADICLFVQEKESNNGIQ